MDNAKSIIERGGILALRAETAIPLAIFTLAFAAFTLITGTGMGERLFLAILEICR